MDGQDFSRREFIKKAAATGVAVGALSQFSRPARAAGPVFKVGLIGCGGRGGGALKQHVEAARILRDQANLQVRVQVVATADFDKGRAERTGQRHGVPKSRCFGGPKAYRKLLETDVDTVLMATPPMFRPVHIEACIEAGKHVFAEKPAGVDPAGCRRVIAAGELARKKKLFFVAGTQYRHAGNYNRQYQLYQEGAYGRILGGAILYCMQKIFSNTPIHPKTPADLAGSGKWQLWVEMSGDHIVEQHVHQMDLMHWFLGGPPVSAVGFGQRARRKAGNMYDFFSIDYRFPGDVRIHSMCRQVSGCYNRTGTQYKFEKHPPKGAKPEGKVRYAEIPQMKRGIGHQQEHVNFLYYRVKGLYINEAWNVATSTAIAIMGREAAYTGAEVKWKDMMENPKSRFYDLKFRPQPEDFETGEVAMLRDGDIRLAGRPR